MVKTRDFVEVIRQRLAADADLEQAVSDEAFSSDVAMEIYNARQEAGLSQMELAARVRTSQSVISRLEDADYDGHSLSLLRKIATALDVDLRVELYPKRKVADAKTTSTHPSVPSEASWAKKGVWHTSTIKKPVVRPAVVKVR